MADIVSLFPEKQSMGSYEEYAAEMNAPGVARPESMKSRLIGHMMVSIGAKKAPKTQAETERDFANRRRL